MGRLVSSDRLELEEALRLVSTLGLVRECDRGPVTLASLHALAATGRVGVDWGIGGWQFFALATR